MASKYIERCMILKDMAAGLMCRVDFLNETLQSPGGRMNVLQNSEWTKVRKKIESSFPTPPDISKLQGGDSFRHSSTSIVEECLVAFDIFLDVIEFKDATLALIKETPSSFTNLKLGQNSVIIRNFFELFVAYVKVHLLWTSIEERKLIVGIYAAAYTHVHGSSDENISKVLGLLHAFASPLTQIAEEMLDVSEWIGELLTEMYDSIFTSMQVEMLFQRMVLNPIEDLDKLTLPAYSTLTPSSTTSLYTELMYVDRYEEWVFYAGLVCPSIFMKFDSASLASPQALSKMVLEDFLVQPIFRSRCLMVHQEIETLAGWFPPRGWGVSTPKGFKMKNFGKELAKASAEHCGLRHREKRAYLLSQLTQLKHLFTTVPGLMGPKFPMLMSGMSMARAEILWFFRHQNAETTKTGGKVLQREHFQDETISMLINLQYELIKMVQEHKTIIQRYFGEYLKGAHRSSIANILDNNQQILAQFGNGVHSIFDSILPILDFLDPENPDATGGALPGWRLNWDRLVSSISMQRAGVLINGELKELACRMETACLHSRFVDDIDGVLKEFCELHDLWFLHDHLMEAFDNALRIGSGTSLAFVHIASSCVNCVHPDCPQDHVNLSSVASREAEMMINTVSEYTENLIGPLWEEYERLAQQVASIEAGNRIERLQAARQKGSQKAPVVNESPAGTESMACCREMIHNIIGFQRAMADVVGHVNRMKTVTIFDKEINPSRLLEERVKAFLKGKIIDITVRNGGETMGRPSDIVGRIYTAAQAIQSALSYVDFDFTPMIRDILFQEFYDLTLPPPGHPLLPISSDMPTSEGSITSICRWFEQFIMQVSQRNSGIVFVEDKKMFMRLSSSVPLQAELYVEKGELVHLCELVGVQGVRAIERAIITIVRNRVVAIKEFISLNENHLHEFRNQYLQETWENPVNRIDNAEHLLEHLVIVGVALSVRSLLQEALEKAINRHAAYLHDISNLVTTSVDKFVGLEVSLGANSLAYDCGVHTSDPDISLSGSLQGLCSNAEDQRIVDLLPFALPSCFTSPWWQQCNYNPELGLCTSNEHLIPLALRKLIAAFQLHKGAQNDPRATTKGVESFVDAASFVLLRMSMKNQHEFRDIPVRTMITLLERFVHRSPLVERSRLETVMPYSLLHASHVDISLGRQKGSDSVSISLASFASDNNFETKEG